jgi:anti-sigma-K factor RskA
MRTSRPELHTLAGAYALDALTGTDRARFERHLARCEHCALEISEFREAAARLAAAAAAEPPPGPTRRPRVPRLALAVAAAAIVAAGLLGVADRTATHRLDEQQLHSHAIAAVLTARDATMLSARVTTGGTATIVISRHQRALLFAAAGLRPLPSSECYELWLMGPGGDRPAGMLPDPRQDMTGPVIASGLTAGDRLGLTIEPAGGAPHPGTTILVIAL